MAYVSMWALTSALAAVTWFTMASTLDWWSVPSVRKMMVETQGVPTVAVEFNKRLQGQGGWRGYVSADQASSSGGGASLPSSQQFKGLVESRWHVGSPTGREVAHVVGGVGNVSKRARHKGAITVHLRRAGANAKGDNVEPVWRRGVS